MEAGPMDPTPSPAHLSIRNMHAAAMNLVCRGNTCRLNEFQASHRIEVWKCSGKILQS